MKIAVISFSGNVGKSTLAAQVLAPRMREAALLFVETLNSRPGGKRRSFDPADYADILISLEAQDDAIVDVGSACAHEFLRQAQRFDSLNSDFELFVVPATSDQKVLADTAATISALNRAGVTAERILCLPSRVSRPSDVPHNFEPILRMCETGTICCRLDSKLYFAENEVFGRLQDEDETVEEILGDPTDWGAKLRAANNETEKINAAARLITKRLAQGVAPELEILVRALTGQTTTR